MGTHDVHRKRSDARVRRFVQAILKDLSALEQLVAEGLIETGARRYGVEQEMFLVDREMRPAPVAEAVLDAMDDPRFTTELARFNLEANLPPGELKGDFLADLERRLGDRIAQVQEAAAPLGASVLLTGILPTLRSADLDLDNMTPHPRYFALNDALRELRGDRFRVFVRGTDVLDVTRDNVMLEAANTSLQLHLQVDVDRFTPLYNLAQAISGPLLACAVNSPLLLGRRLWRETRVALFEHSVDARNDAQRSRGQRNRVDLGQDWLRGSVLDLFRDDVARFPPLLVTDVEEDPEELLDAGRAPALRALTAFNGTVWRWNRPCYGAVDGVAHLRIENRVLPSGPSVIDEVANAALFYGLMEGLAHLAPEIPRRLPFEHARHNFVMAAREGLDARFHWLDDRVVAADTLLRDDLIPAARAGLKSLDVPAADADRYLGVLEHRVRQHQTGADWMVRAIQQRDVNVGRLTKHMQENASKGLPVHEWEDIAPPTGPRRIVSEIMSTDVYTVQPADLVDLAVQVMKWRRLTHVPVEGTNGRIVGLLGVGALSRRAKLGAEAPIAVEAVMGPKPPIVSPDTPLTEVIPLLLDKENSCLCVCEAGVLLGLVTERDLLGEAARAFPLE